VLVTNQRRRKKSRTEEGLPLKKRPLLVCTCRGVYQNANFPDIHWFVHMDEGQWVQCIVGYVPNNHSVYRMTIHIVDKYNMVLMIHQLHHQVKWGQCEP